MYEMVVLRFYINSDIAGKMQFFNIELKQINWQKMHDV